MFVPSKKKSPPLSESHPQVAREADGWDPRQITIGSHSKKKWKCKKGHAWEALVYSRLNSGCPYCSGRLAIKGVNDLRTLNPRLSRELVNVDPTTLKVSSHKKVDWKCKRGHIWKATVSDRSSGKGCPICSGKRILVGFNDLKTTHPVIAKEAFGWNPTTTTAGSGVKRNWKCKKGHLWTVSTSNRISLTSGKTSSCPVCQGLKIQKGFNDLKTLNPRLANEAFGWDPNVIGVSSKRKLSWKCKKGHIFQNSIENRLRGDGCQYCSGRQCLSGFNDLRTTDPQLAKQASGWDPGKISRGSGKLLKWKCAEGHTWFATPNTRTTNKNNGTGCPGCEKNGFNPEKKAYVYLIEHIDWKMLQIGITNSPKSRLAKHRQNGWVQIDIYGPIEGKIAKKIEQTVLKCLKSRKIQFANKAGGKKFDGWTEAWLKTSFEVRTLKKLIQLTKELKESN